MLPLAAALAAFLGAQDEWPTLHRDLQRSGYTFESVPGPYERKWFRDFHDEMIASRTEAIVGGGKVLVGTFAGTLHALRVADGSTAWTFRAGGPIGHSAALADGLVIVGADNGHLYGLRLENGAKVWDYDAGAGIWVAPAVAGDRVYVGDRAGIVHAVRTKDGTPAWIFPTGGMILKPASVSAAGTRIVV
ncbi:MAG: PQQ-like beta-propeller repeat protein, partial [Planctomycetaceae bacterium]|nr:PQQ-like beta-propeller repeat protein [Planctomycetaceae bacterium]